MSISQDLRFHILDIDTPHKALEKLNTFFGIQNQIRAHQLENELLTLDLNNFSSIEDFLSKFKTIRLLLEGCKVKKEDGSLIYSILAKLGPAYSVFVFASIPLEKPSFLQEPTTRIPLLMPFVIL